MYICIYNYIYIYIYIYIYRDLETYKCIYIFGICKGPHKALGLPQSPKALLGP